ncbi:uncharacterized protein LOC144638717 isoform X1 [Oculina patagonica]
MLLKLDVLASTTIKRKKPWPTLAWLGKDVGDLFLFDSHRLSQLYLPSGKTKKKIPLVQSYLEDVQGFGISPNGLFVAGALNSGKLFIWNKSSATVKLTAVLDKIRNVQPGTKHSNPLLYISDCGRKVLLLSGFRQVFLWETLDSNEAANTTGVGDSLRGTWHQIQCGNYVLPDERNKETAIDGVFFVDTVCGTSCSLSWVFNKGDKIHVTTLHLLWPEKNYNFQEGGSKSQIEEGLESSFSPTWHTFKYSLYNLTPAERVMKSRKAYIARISPDGQVLVLAMNQKFAVHNRVMFYSLSQTAVAVIADLKGCGAKMNANGQPPFGKSWWIADMAWTRDSLLVMCITRRGSVAVLTKLGEPLEICTEGCSLHTGPSLFLPLHPKITFQKTLEAFHSDSSESCASEKDPLSQRFSVAVHPYLPVVLSSDGYLVTVMQLPPVASYQGIMTGFMRDVTRLVPDVDVEVQPGNLSRVSSISRINIMQSEANVSRGVTSTDFLSDAPSENNSTGSSTVPGYGLASGDQGMSFFGLSDPELESSLPEYEPGSLDAISHAQSLSIVALALGTACGVNWKQDVGSAMDLTINVVTKFFQFLLQSPESISSSIGDLSKRRSSSPVVDSQLSKALAYFRMVLEVFQWDSTHRNAFAWAFHLTHGIVREVLLLRDASIVYRVATCMRVLKLAERVLNLVYSSGSEKMPHLPSHGSSQPAKFKQEAATKRKEEDLEGAVGGASDNITGSQDHDTNASNLDTQQQLTLCQTHLGGSWLLLYNFTSESCKKMQRRRSSLFSVQEGESRGTAEKKMVELLCEIQEKLQTLGVKIPSNAVEKKENVESVSAYLEGSFHNLPPEGPQDSLFSRRRSSLFETAAQEQSPVTSRRYGSPYRENMGSQQSLHSPGGLSAMGSPGGPVNEQDSKTLLSILYMQLQQYDLRSALDLVYSLIEPAFSCEQFESNANFSLLPLTQSSFQAGSHQTNSNHRMEVLLQNYPIARVADNRGLKVVQTLARFMSAYFSNLSLYVYPPYQPMALPSFHEQQAQREVRSELEDGPQALEHIGLDRAKVSQAVRDQGLYELWSANSTLELLLVSGLVSEGAWLARNLGDWKNAMLLSFANDVLTSRFSETATDPQITLVFPTPPTDIKPDAIALSRLSPSFKKTVTATSGDEQSDSLAEDKSIAHSSTARKSQRSRQGAVDFGIEVDDKIVKEVSRILEAGVVAGLDLVPSILTGLVSQLKHVTSLFEWIVPEEFYLPYPPSFCPQPMNPKKDSLSSAAEKEEKLRIEAASIVQKIFLLLNASNCLVPCVRWYTEQLVVTTESWYNVVRNDSEFPVPSSLAGYADRGFSFHERRADRGSHVSPKKKGKKGSDHKEEKGDEKLPSSIGSVLCSFREFCAVMWLLHARDKMSKSSRKYRQLRSQSTGSEEEASTIHSICWETLLWTTRLTPFSSLLGAADKINDTLLTLLSELPPSTATAELTAQFFNDPEVVQTASGRAKFKRLMAQFRGVSARDDGGSDDEHPDEPLSVYYRKKCMDWEEELMEREKLFGKVRDQFFEVDDAYENATANDSIAVAKHGDQGVAVGSAAFETQPPYFQFLDTFFMITVSKTVLTFHNKAPYPVPLLAPYSKHLLVADTKSLAVLQQKAHSDTPAKPIKGPSSLFRSHSFTDVRSSRSKPEPPPSSLGSGAEIKRSSSLNDVAKLGSLPGVRTLGSQLLEILPSLTWLSKWSMEGSSVPSSKFDLSIPGASDSHPVMRIHVPLPLLVNGLWLLQNIYWPWVSDTEVQVDIKVIRQEISPQRKITDGMTKRSPGVQDVATPPKGLRKVLSDSNIQRSASRSTKRSSIAGQGQRLQEDHHHHKSTPDILRKSQGDARSLVYETTETSRSIPTQAQQEEMAFRRPSRKDLRVTQRLDRIPKSNSEPNIPNIVVQSPTTDEEKDFSGALKKRHSLQDSGRTVVSPGSQTTYHSDTELTSPVKPIESSTPAKTKRSRKGKKKDRKKAEVSDEEKEQARKRHEEDALDWKEQPRQEIERTTNETLATRHPEGPTHPIIRTAPSRQAKRKMKSSVEQKDQERIGAEVAKDSRQRNAVEQAEWSQSSATEALVSQGKMELLLVVRPGDGGQASSLQTGIPLFRIPTLVDSSQSSEVIPPSDKTRQTTRAETASQTEHHRVTSAASQTLQHSGIPSEQEHVTDRSGQMTNTGGDGEIVARTAWVQTEPSIEPKQEVSLPFLPLLQQQQASTLQQQFPPPPTTQYQNQARALPLLHFPVTDPSTKLDLSKMRLLQVPKRSEDSPLLHFPESKPTTSQPAVPDLSKIKFLQIQPKKEIWANTVEPKGPGTEPAPANNWALLRKTGSQARSNGVDLSKMRLYENPPTVREAWPLLETPRPTQAEVPMLIPLEKILAFEKGLRDKLSPFGETAHYPHEKENIRPTVENKPKLVKSHSEPQKVLEQENKRNTTSRQRRRQALEKQARPRSTSPLFKSRRGRAPSRSKSSQGKIITVQPAKKARKVEKVLPEKQHHEKGPVPKKSTDTKPRTVQKVSKKSLKKSVSLSDSELELSEISDQVLDVSEEEKYFRVERSPEPIEVPERDHRVVKSAKDREEKISSEAFEDVMPGPPSMRHIRERIGRKLHEVDRQMSAYRSGSPDWKTALDKEQTESVGGRQKPQETRPQQSTVGIQVDEGEQPPQVKSVGFFHSGLPDRVGASVLKVSSSSQTDQASARPIPVRRDLVTSGVQTEKESVDSDHVMSHAPVLPPDIFLNLQMPKPGQDTQVGVDVVGTSRGLPPEPVVDYHQTVTDRPVSIRGRQLGVDVGSERGDAPPTAPKIPEAVRGRQFLSVADIDHEQWLEVQSTPMTSTTADGLDEGIQEGRRDSVHTETEPPSRTASHESQNYESEEEQERAKQKDEKHYEGRDRVTVEMMDSTDVPIQRFYPLPFPTAPQSSARAVSTQFLNERMKEMSERIEAMDQITHNMDREFKSSRVLLSAIQSIDEVLNPSSRASSSRGSGESRRGMPRRWGDTAPWRRKGTTSAGRQPATELPQTEDVEDSIGVDVDHAKKDETADEANVEGSKEGETDNEDIEEEIDSEKDEHDDDRSFSEDQEGENVQVASTDGEEKVSDEEEEIAKPKQWHDSSETEAKSSVDKGNVPSFPQDSERREKPQASPLDSLTLSHDKLKEIFQDKDVKRTRRDPSPDARQHLKEWMKEKRSERQAEWKGQQEELRAQEHQPFMSPTQGSTNFKKMKLMEQERNVKRRKKEDQYNQKRMESASNLLSEMLAEPVPKPTDRKPNLRYGGSVNSRYSTSLAGKKKRTSERNKKLPKAPLKGKRGRQESAPTKENRLLEEQQYHVDSPLSEEVARRGQADLGVRSQNTPRYDLIRTSSPVTTAEYSLRRSQEENIDEDRDKYSKEKQLPTDDFWRSKSPTGAEFVTTRTYRKFVKEQPKRFKARDAAMRKTPPGGLGGYGLSQQLRGTAAMGRTFQRTRPTDPLLPGGETLAEIDRLLEDIPDDGSTFDQERLEGIESLLEGDDELRDLLSDVDWRAISKPQRADSVRAAREHSSVVDARGRDWRSKVGQGHMPRHAEPAVPSDSSLLPEFDGDVSLWNTRESMRASDDVAQLLAEVDEAVGNMSESTGSTRSQIDWEEVDKIMGET